MRDGEVVGLAADNNGRSCAKHECCGEHVFVGDLVQFKKTLVWYNGKLDEAVKVVLIKNKKETCTVAFMPRNIAYARANEFHMKFGRILELYHLSDNSQKRRKSYRNKGMASFKLVEFNVVNNNSNK